jgi:hypothetical protein
MTEMVSSMSEGNDTASVSAPVSSPASSESYSSSQTQPEEKLFRQSEINDIVKRAKYGAVEDYKRKVAERPDYVRQKEGDDYSLNQNQSQIRNAQLTPDDVRRMAVEESQRLRDEWIHDAQRKEQETQAQRIVQEFFTKLSTGKDKYQDFDKVVGDIDYGRFPNVVQLANSHVDNTHDVMYELGKDRTKLAMLEQLVHMSPRDAIVQIQRLSQSIKDNESAGKMRHANEPLSQMRPSNAGMDNGALSVKDLRNKYRA